MDIYTNILLKDTSDEINLKNLDTMIFNHITTFKFSNIDYFNKDFDFNYPENIIDRIITKKYGICMDLNYALSLLLTKRNYKNYLVKCYKPGSRSESIGVFHLSIIVIMNNEKYFVDVGFGGDFVKSILLLGNIDEFFIKTNDELLRIIDRPVNLKEMKENYTKVFKTKPGEMELTTYVFERIYDPYLQKYVVPKKICRL